MVKYPPLALMLMGRAEVNKPVADGDSDAESLS